MLVLEPVSYTHLDVYKRQPAGRKTGQPGDRLSFCPPGCSFFASFDKGKIFLFLFTKCLLTPRFPLDMIGTVRMTPCHNKGEKHADQYLLSPARAKTAKAD